VVRAGFAPLEGHLLHRLRGARPPRAEQRALVIALALDQWHRCRAPADYTMGQEFCDAAWRPTMARLGRHRGSFDSLPVASATARCASGSAGAVLPGAETRSPSAPRCCGTACSSCGGTSTSRSRSATRPRDWFALGLLRASRCRSPTAAVHPERSTRGIARAVRARAINACTPRSWRQRSSQPGIRRGWPGGVQEKRCFWLDADEAMAPGGGGAGPPRAAPR